MKKFKRIFSQFPKDTILHFTGGMLGQLILQIWFVNFVVPLVIMVVIAVLIEVADYYQSGKNKNNFSRKDIFFTILGAFLALWISHVYIPIL